MGAFSSSARKFFLGPPDQTAKDDRLEAPPGGGHLLSVCNDGPALPPGFDPAAGTGLGMKIMLALVEQIGGTLQIGPCAQCQGTRFAVAFI